jgi:septal ring factor EnvC (AmiA/AmiB activator)
MGNPAHFGIDKLNFFRYCFVEFSPMTVSHQYTHQSSGGVPMQKLNRMVAASALAILFSLSLVLVGCSSSPDEAQMKQLNDLKAEVASLQKDVASKEQQKAALDREIGEKNAKLKKCADDQAIVKQRLAK